MIITTMEEKERKKEEKGRKKEGIRKGNKGV